MGHFEATYIEKIIKEIFSNDSLSKKLFSAKSVEAICDIFEDIGKKLGEKISRLSIEEFVVYVLTRAKDVSDYDLQKMHDNIGIKAEAKKIRKILENKFK